MEREAWKINPLDALVMDRYHKVPIIDIKGTDMSKNTSMTLGKHFDGFIAHQIEEGRFASASEVVRAALRMFEDNEQKIATLRHMLEEGERSGTAEYSYESLMNELDEELD